MPHLLIRRIDFVKQNGHYSPRIMFLNCLTAAITQSLASLLMTPKMTGAGIDLCRNTQAFIPFNLSCDGRDMFVTGAKVAGQNSISVVMARRCL